MFYGRAPYWQLGFVGLQLFLPIQLCLNWLAATKPIGTVSWNETLTWYSLCQASLTFIYNRSDTTTVSYRQSKDLFEEGFTVLVTLQQLQHLICVGSPVSGCVILSKQLGKVWEWGLARWNIQKERKNNARLHQRLLTKYLTKLPGLPSRLGSLRGSRVPAHLKRHKHSHVDTRPKPASSPSWHVISAHTRCKKGNKKKIFIRGTEHGSFKKCPLKPWECGSTHWGQ